MIINRSTRRTFISNGLAVSGALAFGVPDACFAVAEAQTKRPDPDRKMQITGPGSLKAHARATGLLLRLADKSIDRLSGLCSSMSITSQSPHSSSFGTHSILGRHNRWSCPLAGKWNRGL